MINPNHKTGEALSRASRSLGDILSAFVFFAFLFALIPLITFLQTQQIDMLEALTSVLVLFCIYKVNSNRSIVFAIGFTLIYSLVALFKDFGITWEYFYAVKILIFLILCRGVYACHQWHKWGLAPRKKH